MPGGGRARSGWTALDEVTLAGDGRPVRHTREGSGELRPGHVVEIQRSRILAAMVEVSAEHGAANVTVAHIVERAGVSRRTFYELYRDREECFLGAFDDAIARASRWVLDGYDSDAKWAVRVRSALVGLLTFLEVEKGAGQLLVVGSLGAGAAALERRRQALAQMIALVDEGGVGARTGVELPPLTAEGIVGGVLSVLHARLLDTDPRASASANRCLGSAPVLPVHPSPQDASTGGLLALTGSLMGMIVLPYLGPAAARRELARPVPTPASSLKRAPADPLRDVGMRLTYRTVRVLTAVGARPGSSNREVGLGADMQDQGQISKLLTRLARLGLIENGPAGLARGAPNAWVLTAKGREIEQAIGQDAAP